MTLHEPERPNVERGETSAADGGARAQGALEAVQGLIRRARCADERELLAATAEVVRKMTGAGRARAIVSGDETDPSARVAAASATDEDVSGPIVLDAARAAGESVTVSLPLFTAGVPVGTVLL